MRFNVFSFCKLFIFVLLLLPAIAGFGNGIKISKLRLNGSDAISFDISWENAWRLEGIKAPYNHDAAWVFIKYRATGGGWMHLDLSSDIASHQADNFTVEPVSDGKGVFLSKKQPGSGSVSGTVTLKWKHFFFANTYDFKVFAMEMVWVPQAGYYLGDGASQSVFRRGDSLAPLYVNSDGAILLGKDSLSLNDTGKYAPEAAIPAAYPNGFNGFYCMKYEITQEQYVDFLNTLSFAQQKQHTVANPSSVAGTLAFGNVRANRNGIIIKDPGAEGMYAAVYACNVVDDGVFLNEDDGMNRACNMLSWNDLTAFLDWAALRPMTELEYEKSCRGPEYPVKKAFAWNTAYITDANTLENDGTAAESVKEFPAYPNGLASHGYNGPQGPLRAGFGGSDSSGRLTIGAAYYGILEMSGNLWEMCVTVNKKGLSFTGMPGDGKLDISGNTDEAGWPNASGAGHRGGGWNSGILDEFRDLAVSDRFYAGQAPATRRPTTGGRGVRGL